VEVVFLMPVNAEGDDPFERPSTLLARLARRVEGLARWQDAAIAADWPALAAAWREASYGLGQLRRDFTMGASAATSRSAPPRACCASASLRQSCGRCW
jgi:hypothetical protein